MSLDVDLTDGWATIDEEIQNAIPTETPPGYTDELNELDVSGVEPFFVEAEEPEVEAEAEVENEPDVSEEDVVSDELAAGIELWTFDNEPVEQVLEEAVVRLRRSASDSDLFAFADTDDQEVLPVDVVEMAEPEPWEPLGVVEEAVSMSANAESAPVDDELVEPVAGDVMLTGGQAGDAVRSAIAHLGVDAALFERARQAKAQLVQDGRDSGR